MTRSTLPPADWLIPDWPAPPGVRAVCTTRGGGLSAAPYDSLNLGSHVGDKPEHVQHNRAWLQSALGVRPVFMNQVHGTDVLELSPQTQDGATADATYTRQRGLACTVMVADCLPVLLCDVGGTQIAAAHAGWRGLAGAHGQGVLEQTFKSFRPLAPVKYSQHAIEIIAWLGPCIGPEVFEVGAEVVAAFTETAPLAHLGFKPLAGGKWLANLPLLARQRLEQLGVSQVFGNDGTPPWCTVTNASKFFSYRRDGFSGRQAACIWLE